MLIYWKMNLHDYCLVVMPTQLWSSTSESSRSRNSSPQEAMPCLTREGVGSYSPPGSLPTSIYFPSKHQVPIAYTQTCTCAHAHTHAHKLTMIASLNRW